MKYRKIDEKWRFLMMRYLFYIVLMIFALEIAVLLYVNRYHMLSSNIRTYLLKYTLLPTLTNILSLMLGYHVLKRDDMSYAVKNYVPIVCMIIFCFDTATVHNYFYITAATFIIPVMMSSFYGSRLITTYTMIACVIILVYSTICKGYDASELDQRMRILNGAVAGLLLTASYLLSLIMMEQMQEKERALKENILARYDLEEQLRRDPLTGLYNHTEFYAYLEDKINRIGELGAEIYLAVIDIDYFKQVNDAYGHEKGNVILIELSKMMVNYCGTEGHACRYGGEEFAIVFTDIEKTDVIERMDSMRRELTKQTYIPEVHISVSVGIASYTHPMTSQALFDKADQAMYMAKERGRNQVVAFA